ncbi:MAG: electron transfer flavoprotein subunit alpha/FixB family protein [Desulfobacteraceae bacterium]|nr:electron transfer flavoprotein subunit alpha/FixB family protein [Desulfobacteraceae bacterium]
MAGIWVFAESREHTRELLGAGRELADRMGTTLGVFAQGASASKEYIACGADEVFVLPVLGEDEPLEACVPVLADAVSAGDPDVIFIGATARGKTIAARLASRLKTGLCSCCSGFVYDEGDKLLRMERMVYGGAGIQTVVCETRPQMATIAPRTFAPAPEQEGRSGKVSELPVVPESGVKVLDRLPRQRGAVDVTRAKAIVCVGRGVEKAEDITLARDLADVLGAEVACSRPIAEELQWLPEDVYLGISGKRVKPELYVGVGVSGQIQHVTGIRDSRVIFAINRDENAPIFEAADFGIVGDLYQVVPKLIDEFKAALKA